METRGKHGGKTWGQSGEKLGTKLGKKRGHIVEKMGVRSWEMDETLG